MARLFEPDDRRTVLTVKQPWAELIMGAKTVENRSWRTKYRGRLFIHAAARPEREMATLLASVPTTLVEPDRLTLGAIIGWVELVDCVQGCDSPWAIDGQWHWLLEDPHRLSQPIPARGQLGLWSI